MSLKGLLEQKQNNPSTAPLYTSCDLNICLRSSGLHVLQKPRSRVEILAGGIGSST